MAKKSKKKVVDMARTSRGKKKPRERAKQNRVKSIDNVPVRPTYSQNDLPNPGRPRLYTPEDLLSKAKEYLQWAEDNPLYETKIVMSEGYPLHEKVPKMRAVTMWGFELFAGVHPEYVADLRRDKPEEYSRVIKIIERAIYLRKFEGAAADMLNANIISRDLGLKERTDVTSGDEPIPTPKFEVYNAGPTMAANEKDIPIPKDKQNKR